MSERTEALMIACFFILIVSIGLGLVTFFIYKALMLP